MRLTSFAAVALVVGASAVLSAPAAGQAPTECQGATVVAPVVADAWVDFNSPLANKGADAVLDVSGDTRALVRFQLPPAVPEGCVVESARLRLYADSGAEGYRVEAVPLAAPFAENSVNWENQPQAAGAPATAWSIDGYMTWNVTAHVREMIGSVSHGWLVRDALEGTDVAGGHGFYAREKGENAPQVVIRFAPPPTGEPGPPAPPQPAAVTCGQLVTSSILVTNDLRNCAGDGLVIGAPRIIVDLDGHTIDGVGLGDGIRNEGYGSVTVRNGTVQEFDYGVRLLAETALNVVSGLTLRGNEVAGIELFDADDGNEVRGNTLQDNGGGLLLLSGTTGAIAADNTLTLNSGGALEVRDSDRNRLEGNDIVGGGDLGVGLERATGNVLVGNVVSGTSDGGIELLLGSHGNRVEQNDVSAAGDTGIMVKESDRNVLVANSTQGMSDSGITLSTANDGVVAGNDLGANPGGLQVDGSSRNLISGNTAVGGGGIGIELGGGSFGNTLVANTASANGAAGIYVADEALLDPLGLDPSNVITQNTTNGNAGDGIALAKGGHVVVGNAARNNRGYGINAGPGTIDGSRNAASGNAQTAQCIGVFCKAEWNPPETEIEDHPAEFTREPSATFTFEGEDDTSAPGALTFECRLYRDVASAFAPCTSPQAFAGLSTGTYTFEVRATDAAGNVDESPASFTWTIDATPPETAVDSGPPALTNGIVASFAFSASEEGSTFECSLDGALFEACSSPASYAGLADGSHTLEVRATDRAGNVDGSPASYAWTVDTVAPETSIDSAPAALTNSVTATFAFSASEVGSSLECSLDGAAFAACTSPATYADLADGEHTLRVRAADRAGNADASPASFTWTVDTVAPDTAIDSGPDPLTNRDSATFAFSADEPATFACALDDAAFAPCSSPAVYENLGEGEHTLRVRATDRAGNTDPSPTSRTWTIDTTPPQTTIATGPPTLTNSAGATFTFSSNESGATFACALDEGDFEPCTSSTSYAGLADGEHTVRVRATDAASNTDGSPATRSWTVDTVAPDTAIDTGPSGLTNSAHATFTFSANEAGSSFECALDAGGFEPCTSPRTYTDLAEGEHNLRVRATDPAGNADAPPATRAWSIDTIAPHTAIDTGPDAQTTSTNATFTFSSNESGSSFACSLDGGGYEPCTSPASYTDLEVGQHELRVRATDAARNTDATPAIYSWQVRAPDIPDTTAPDTAIGARPDDPTNSRSASFAFTGSDDRTPHDQLAFECSLDGATFAPCTSPQQYANIADGSHTFRVRATDAAGNTDSSPAAHTWRIDATAPQTTITNAPAPSTTSTGATFTFSSNETGATFECSLDGAAFAACASPHQYTDLADGSHTFRVRATDAAGNVDDTPASRTWSIDATAPQTTINSAPAASITSTSASFTFSSEAGASFECSLDNGAFAACTSPRQHTGLAAGTHTFRVRARDAAGNVDDTPATHTWTIDITAPQTTINSGPPARTNTTSATFTFSSNETGATFECSLDNATFTACTSPRTYTGLSVATHGFRVRARDLAGNIDATPAAHSWVIDTTAPNTTINTGPPAQSTSPNASFTFSSEAGATFECSLDNAAFTACASPQAYSGLAAGAHNFRVRARDAAGNVDASPASQNWTITISAPPAPCAAVTASATADAWVDQNSTTSNKGSDSVLKVQSKAPTDNFRALVRFAMPASVPQGCVLSSATLRLFAGSARTGRTLHALRLASTWTENAVNWGNQPQTTGAAAAVASGTGYREWDVTAHVQAIFQEGVNNGFLIRDAVEGADAEQQFYSREKGESPPQLVLRYAAVGG